MNQAKKLERAAYNTGRKIIKAEQRRQNLVQLGKTLKAVEDARDADGANDYLINQTLDKLVDNDGVLVEPVRPSINRLTWLNAKQYAQAFGARKNRPGEHILHTEAIVEDASRAFTKEVDKAMTPVEAPPEAA